MKEKLLHNSPAAKSDASPSCYRSFNRYYPGRRETGDRHYYSQPPKKETGKQQKVYFQSLLASTPHARHKGVELSQFSDVYPLEERRGCRKKLAAGASRFAPQGEQKKAEPQEEKADPKMIASIVQSYLSS